MATYRQFCAVAKALDVVGDRWALLIVRELLLTGPARYTDLLGGLPGIATNLLASRLRQLEGSGIVRRRVLPPPVARTVIELTPRGEALRPVITALGRWGAPLLADADESDAFRSHWLALPLGEVLADGDPDGASASLEVRSGDSPLLIEVGQGAVTVRPGSIPEPDGVLSGPPDGVLDVLFGRTDLAAAGHRGVDFTGDLSVLKRVRPAPSRDDHVASNDGMAPGDR